MRLLVVDDDALFREELASALGDLGHDVTAASSVPKAIEALEAEPFDLVFTDLKMPRHGGAELLAEVRRRWPATAVIVVTGFATVETAVEMMKLGAFDYISKPFRLAQIEVVLKRWAEEHRFVQGLAPEENPVHLARRWADEARGPVRMYIEPAPSGLPPSIEVAPPRPDDLSAWAADVEAAAHDAPTLRVVLTGLGEAFRRHRRDDVLRTIERMARALGDGGALAVGVDPGTITADDVRALSATLAAPGGSRTMEALAGPIRRAVLRRLRDGPARFTDLVEASGVDESPKLAFHLRRLVDDGLVGRAEEEYRLTPKGVSLVAWLDELNAIEATSSSGRRLFVVRPGAAEPFRGRPRSAGSPPGRGRRSSGAKPG